jgi:Eco57I restriction-modification methylase/TaqI-like C-terminal specificity domain
MTNNVKPLFSEHYLTRRIPETSLWNEDISKDFQYLQNLYKQKQSILSSLNESQTENEWIQPILERLGFSYIVQTSLRKSGKVQRPDYSLFLDDNTKQEAYNLINDETAFYSRTVAIADAKYWQRPLSENLKSDRRDTFKNSNPSFQIVNYLDGTRVDWGILTNGCQWRLYYRLSSSPIQQFYEIDLVKILLDNDLEQFKYFWLFFRKKAFIKDSQNQNFLEKVREESTNYARQIEGELKKLVFNQVFANLAGGFVANFPSPPFEKGNKGGISSSLIYQATLSFLYKILFLLYAEAKNLLPIDQESYREYSLSLLLKGIAEKCERSPKFSVTSTQYYDRLLSLFKIIDRGDPSLNVPAYNGGLFKVTGDHIPETNQFLLQYKLTDAILAPTLDQLARIKGEPIDYKFLGVRDLGSIYEGLLEYKLVIDDITTGQVHLENDKGERRETGSYYTPEYIVNYIVQNTLDPILQAREKQFQELMTEIHQLLKDLQDQRKNAKTIKLLRQDLDKLQRKTYHTLLDIKVCDPAMGSGHFLVTTVDYITRKIINILNNYPENNPVLEQLERIKEDIINNLQKQGININPEQLSPDNLLHRMVMKRCIYGVDLNPMAVELAKVSLWLHSFTVGAPLSFLDHHLRCGNSLIGCMAKDVQKQFISADETEGFLPLFQTPFHGLLQSANVMQEIANLSDATFAQVEQSQQYYNSFDEQAKPYKRLLDVYISQHFGLKQKEVNSFFRFRLNDLSATVNKSDEKLLETAKKLYEEKRFFHWDLEFPEVFIDLSNADWKENGGFDVVLGNPPYVSANELNKSLSNYEKPYWKNHFQSASGAYDLYILFLEQATKLTGKLGFSSMITPNKFLSAPYGQSVREYLKENIEINQLLDCSQIKVFEDPSVYPVVFIFHKKLPLKEYPIKVLTPQRINNIQNSNVILQNSSNLDKLPDNIWGFLIADNLYLLLKIESNSMQLQHCATVKASSTASEADNYENAISDIQVNTSKKFINTGLIDRYDVLWGLETLTHKRNNFKFPYLDLANSVVSNTRKLQYNQPKIAIAKMALRLEGFFDIYGEYSSANTNFIYNTKYNLGYILTLINSKLMAIVYQNYFGSLIMSGGYFQFQSPQLKVLPIRKINFTTKESDRTLYLKQLTHIYEQNSEVLSKVQQHLQQDQIDVIHDFLAYLAEQMIALNQQKQTETKDFLTWLSREIGAEIDNLTNKSSIKNYLGDYQKSQDNLTFDELLAILKKNRKKLTIDPSERKFQTLLLKEYETSVNTLLPIKQKLTYTDKLIDEIVYQLYGLSEEEIAIIEEK